MTAATRVELLTGAADALGTAIADAALSAGASVAAIAPRGWMVDRLRERLGVDRALAGLVAPGDAQAAAGFVKGAQDALGPITDVICASVLLRPAAEGAEPGGDLEELLDANLRANSAVVRAALPSLRRRARGRLALPAWTDELADVSVNCRASIAAIEAFAAGLEVELKGAGVALDRVPANAPAAAWI